MIEGLNKSMRSKSMECLNKKQGQWRSHQQKCSFGPKRLTQNEWPAYKDLHQRVSPNSTGSSSKLLHKSFLSDQDIFQELNTTASISEKCEMRCPQQKQLEFQRKQRIFQMQADTNTDRNMMSVPYYLDIPENSCKSPKSTWKVKNNPNRKVRIYVT